MKIKNLKRIYFPNKSGFTLVELLVVIAVLGVLAAVVIVALNPAEQLNRGRDAGRTSSVTQLGGAMQSYATNLGTGSYPLTASGATWQTTYLIANKEINTLVSVPVASGGVCNVDNGETPATNICYTSNGTDAVIWTIDESQSAKSKAGCTVASGTPIAVSAWIASQGKAGITCVATVTTVPAYTATLN